MLSIELRDRTAQVVHVLDQQVAAGAREDEALSSLFADRNCRKWPRTASASPATRTRSRARWTWIICSLELEIAARFHDVGKLAMPEALMSKPSPLTSRARRRSCASTPTSGAEILESTRNWPARRRPSARRTSGSREADIPEKVAGDGDSADEPHHRRRRRVRRHDPGPRVPHPPRFVGRGCGDTSLQPLAIRSTNRGRIPRGPRPPLTHRLRDELVPQPDTFAPPAIPFAST